ncbi:uncharacterized protein [Pyxicephalus adspersus]|uniref:uncharacterized protein n=1 Tax=Pyxicephalus adspersus TaxID=30357 RepID=UPI003B5AF851
MDKEVKNVRREITNATGTVLKMNFKVTKASYEEGKATDEATMQDIVQSELDIAEDIEPITDPYLEQNEKDIAEMQFDAINATDKVSKPTEEDMMKGAVQVTSDKDMHPTEEQHFIESNQTIVEMPLLLKKIEKPGTCPADVDYPRCEGSTLGMENECGIDKKCQGKKKCCFSGCRRRCLLPLDAKENPCPYHNDTECIHVKPAPFECHEDKQCQGTDRCCNKNCRLQCVPTMKEKPGKCPIPITRCAYPPPPPKCLSDHSCPGNLKCCTPKCGLECTKPVFSSGGLPVDV